MDITGWDGWDVSCVDCETLLEPYRGQDGKAPTTSAQTFWCPRCGKIASCIRFTPKAQLFSNGEVLV